MCHHSGGNSTTAVTVPGDQSRKTVVEAARNNRLKQRLLRDNHRVERRTGADWWIASP
jgi:hypothetical protein